MGQLHASHRRKLFLRHGHENDASVAWSLESWTSLSPGLGLECRNAAVALLASNMHHGDTVTISDCRSQAMATKALLDDCVSARNSRIRNQQLEL